MVTGAGGYLATALCKRLANLGVQVHAFYRSKINDELQHPNIKLFQGDLLDPKSIAACMQNCEYVFHPAAHADNWAKDEAIFYKVNVQGTLNIMEAALQLGVKKVVCTSTAGVIGPAYQNEAAHSAFYRKTGFFGPYEESKMVCDEQLRTFLLLNEKAWAVTCHPTRIYGPGVRGRSNTVSQVIEDYAKGKWHLKIGKGLDVANYVYIDDVVDGHILALLNGQRGAKYLLSGANTTFIGLLNEVEALSGQKSWLIGVPHSFIAFYTKIEDFLSKFGLMRPKMTYAWARKLKESWATHSDHEKQAIGYEGRSISEGVKATLQWLKIDLK